MAWLIVKYQPYGRRTGYATIADSELRVTFVEELRVKRTIDSPLGPMRELEGTGKFRRDRVRLDFHEATDSLGGKVSSSYSSLHTRVLDHRKVVRVLEQKDLAQLATYDQVINRLREEIAEIRRSRAEHLKKSWRRAQPWGINELEAKANAKL